MASKFLINTARVVSILLMLGAASAAITAISAIYNVGPEGGGLGVILVDGFFGAFILFIASRFLWIYAAKRAQALDNAADTPDAEQEAD